MTRHPASQHLPLPDPFRPRRRRRGLRAPFLLPLLALSAGLGLLGTAPPANAAPNGSVAGFVQTQSGVAVADAHVTLSGPQGTRTGLTAADGKYVIGDVPFGEYEIRATAPCRNRSSTTVTVDGPELRNLDFLADAYRFDAFGYACRPSAFSLIGDSGSLPITGDDQSIGVALPFSFPFYGTAKTSMNVSTNGYLTFGPSADAAKFNNTAPGTLGTPPDSIFVLWDDLFLDAQSEVLTGSAGAAPTRAFMVEWRDVLLRGDPGAGRITFQVQLLETGQILMAYRDIDPSAREEGSSATIGLQSGSLTTFLTSSFDTATVVDGLKLGFATNRPPTAGAGPDATVASGHAFSLDGSATDPDGGQVRFLWTQLAGPATTISDRRKADPTVSGSTGPATLQYRVEVFDTFGRSALDTVTITVQAPTPK